MSLSLGCEVPACGWTTPALPEHFYSSMVEQLQVHHATVHSLTAVGARPAKEVAGLEEETPEGEAMVDQEDMEEGKEVDSAEEGGEKLESGNSGKGGKVPVKKGGVEKVAMRKKGGEKATRIKEGGERGPWRAEDGEKVLGRRGPRRLDLGHLCTRCNLVSCRTAAGLAKHHRDFCGREVPRYECQQCDEVFGSKQWLYFHKRKVHSNDISNIKCEACGKVFWREYFLLRHKCNGNKAVKAEPNSKAGSSKTEETDGDQETNSQEAEIKVETEEVEFVTCKEELEVDYGNDTIEEVTEGDEPAEQQVDSEEPEQRAEDGEVTDSVHDTDTEEEEEPQEGRSRAMPVLQTRLECAACNKTCSSAAALVLHRRHYCRQGGRQARLQEHVRDELMEEDTDEEIETEEVLEEVVMYFSDKK